MPAPRYRSIRPPPSLGLGPDEERRLRALRGVLEHFEMQSPQMPVAMASAFLSVALNEGASLRELVELSGRPQSTVSRWLLDLSNRDRKGGPGLGLVEWKIAPEELRRKEYRLTAKGRALLRHILSEKFIAEQGEQARDEGKLTSTA